ncbi:hypothetical protein BABINDRAFT_163067 [Babjeviella inositovora NRRL Y-12698]|uniref:Aspartokinase n=1 Tax=Babjeviella inositovora NRRL Y-12698 TaxID=984486 RepID=A0A1E3QK05_9ASCO|nr:uncharacterized protein BABINDRAFT_163067 [Babjeviella inositovora NRRL Y-12698]ODQ78026.1 hypothetical protein BABINDRAFT_163067 [Babjeviella inositovora NRRL Y-12698]
MSAASSVTSTRTSSKKGWIVQKFGGTSVGKFPEKITDEVVQVFSKSNRVAVVCSARSSQTKSEGTTSRLLQASDVSIDGGDFQAILELIKVDHVKNAHEKISDHAIQQQLIEDTIHEVDHAAELLHASQIIGEVLARTLDNIMAVGEKLSCLFMAALMNDRGVKAQYVDLSEVIPNKQEGAHALDTEFYMFLAKVFSEKVIELEPDVVPVLTGYFGTVPGGLLNGVGRGYTDLCAALLAVGLGADELQIWKEVDGIFTADPRKVPNARLLPAVTPDEAAELTYYGSEVIHPFTMEQVIKARIPIRIKNVINPTGTGTIIYPDDVGRRGVDTPPHPPTALAAMPQQFLQKKKAATAITSKNEIVVINIHSNRKTLSHGFLAHIFSTMDRYKLVVDLISTSEVHVSMALQITAEGEHALRLSCNELRLMGSVDILRHMSIISLVGKQMKQFVGIAGTMFKTLADSGINIEMISQGANEINISCVINEDDSLKALRAVHSKLLESSVVDLRLEMLRSGGSH